MSAEWMDGMEVKETEVTDEWQRKKFFNYVLSIGAEADYGASRLSVCLGGLSFLLPTTNWTPPESGVRWTMILTEN